MALKVVGDREEGKKGGTSFSSSPPSPFCACHAGYWYRRLQRHDLMGKNRTINRLGRLFLVQDMSFVTPLAKEITILIEGKWINWSTLGPPWIQNCFRFETLEPGRDTCKTNDHWSISNTMLLTVILYRYLIPSGLQCGETDLPLWSEKPKSSASHSFHFSSAPSLFLFYLSGIYLAELNLQWGQFKVDVWKIGKWTCIRNSEQQRE